MTATPTVVQPKSGAKSGWAMQLIHALVHAVAAAVAAWPLTSFGSTTSAALGAFAGCLLGVRLGRTALRLPLLPLVALVGLLFATLARGLFTNVDSVALALGPESALYTGDLTFFFFGAASLSLGLRALSERKRLFGGLEVLFVAFAFAQLVVAHRQGAINRPFELADAVIAAGGDPTVVFFSVGSVATVLVVLLLLRETGLGVLRHLVAISMLLLLFFIGTAESVFKMPPPPGGGDGLGLRGDQTEEEEEGGGGRPEEGEGQAQNGEGEGRQNDELEFRDDAYSDNENVPVAVVLFHDEYSPPSGTYYFRQGAFSQYNGNRLVAATDAGLDRDLAREFPLRAYDIDGAPPMNANRTAVQTTVAMLTEHTRPFGLEAPVTLMPATNPDPERFLRTYSVTSAVLAADFVSMMDTTAGDPTWTPEARAHYLEGPEDARYATLAEEILTELLPMEMRHKPMARVAAITHWLGREGTYSLQSNHAQADDVTADFLFGDRTGYCVHFAHAGAYLLRSVGVPARVATGYAIAEENRRGGSALLVSGSTSHAWPEVYVDGVGWVVADIAPQTVLSSGPPPTDPNLQQLLGELARGLEPIPPEPDAPLPAAIQSGIDILRILGWLLASLAAALFLFITGWKLWRAWAPSFADDQKQAVVAYRAALDRLGENKIRRKRGESREAFARRIADRFPSLTPLTTHHVGKTFGSKRPFGKNDAAKLLSQLRQEIRTHCTAPRRLLGALTPWSWILSR